MRAREAQKLKAQIEAFEELQQEVDRVHDSLSEHERTLKNMKSGRHLKYDKVLLAAWKEAQKQVARAKGATYLFQDLLEQRIDENTEKLDEADAWDQ